MIDAHLHLYTVKSGENTSPDSMKKKLSQIYETKTRKEIETDLFKLADELEKNKIKKGLVYLVDERFYTNKWFPVEKIPENFYLGVLINPMMEDIRKKIELAVKNKIKIFKLQLYEQKLFKEHYKDILKLAKIIEEYSGILNICGAYGSRYIYKTNGVELAAYLLNEGITSPIIIAHGGMIKIFDTMSLMLDFKNLYMDTAFTFNFWWGSTVIDDYKFALKKIEYNNVFFGSDYPHVKLNLAKKYFNNFCEYSNISEDDKIKIEEQNFKKFEAYLERQ